MGSNRYDVPSVSPRYQPPNLTKKGPTGGNPVRPSFRLAAAGRCRVRGELYPTG